MEQSPSSQIPVSNLRRSSSLRVRGERPLILCSTSPFPSIVEREEGNSLPIRHWTPTKKSNVWRSRSHASEINIRDDDVDSLESFASGISRSSSKSICQCEHSLFAKNGTTFSGRTNKYVEHCSGQYCNTPEEYLTPTQRANRHIQRLKNNLQSANEKLLEKDKEILKLTQEVVDLRVYKTTYCLEDSRDSNKVSPRGKSPWEVRENMMGTPDYLLSSLADSGQYDVDDLASSAISTQSKDSLNLPLVLTDVTQEVGGLESTEELVKMYEELLKTTKDDHVSEIQAMKHAHEEIIQKLVDSFDKKMKNAEYEFEEQTHDLLAKAEAEKAAIVEKYEEKLEKRRLEFLIKTEKEGENRESQTEDQSEAYDEFSVKLDEEKKKFENRIEDIKTQYQMKHEEIEKNFEVRMEMEREKLEAAATIIQATYDEKFRDVSLKCSDAEKKFEELSEEHQKSLMKISKLEEENTLLEFRMADEESRQKELYLKMFLKGQEAVKYDSGEDAVDSTSKQQMAGESNIGPVPELLVQLKVTQVELENLKDKEYRAQHCDEGVSQISAKEALSLWMLAARKAMYKRLAETQRRATPAAPAADPPSSPHDPQATLQFLKSSVYYFLTDRDNHLRHLRAIENILGFSSNERKDIDARYVH